MELIQDIETKEMIFDTIPKGGVGAELGVCRGTNAVQLLFRTEPVVLHLVDIWTPFDKPQPHDCVDQWYGDHEEYVQKLFQKQTASGLVKIHRTYTVSWLESIEDQSLDWVFLDSNHRYQCISRELEFCVKKVKKGGLIMGHDYCTVPICWGSSVIRAVQERIQTGEIKMKAITKENYPTFMAEVQ